MEFMQSPSTTTEATSLSNGAESARKEGLMASTTFTLETEVREFAREFPTPNVQRAVALCEAGTLTWAEVHKIFQASLAEGLEAVK